MFAWSKFDAGLISLTTVWGRQKNRERKGRKRRKVRRKHGAMPKDFSRTEAEEAGRWKLGAQEVRTYLYPRTFRRDGNHTWRENILRGAENVWKWRPLVGGCADPLFASSTSGPPRRRFSSGAKTREREKKTADIRSCAITEPPLLLIAARYNAFAVFQRRKNKPLSSDTVHYDLKWHH